MINQSEQEQKYSSLINTIEDTQPLFVDEDDYQVKFQTLIAELRESRINYEDAEPQEREQKFAEWEILKQQFNLLVGTHRTHE